MYLVCYIRQVRGEYLEWAAAHGGDVADVFSAFMEERILAAASAIARAQELAQQQVRRAAAHAK
jgi:hypothetical protein